MILLMTMLSYSWVSLASLCCIACLTYYILVLRWRNRVQPPLPPGPKGLPVVGMLPFMNPQLHTYFNNLSHTYGPLMSLRLGMKTVVIVSSPLVAKQVFKDLDTTFVNHDVGAAARVFSHSGNDILFAPYGPRWRLLRKVSANGMLGHAALNGTSGLRREWLNHTLRYVREQAGCPIDIGDMMFLVVFNMMESMLWGKASMKLEKDKEVPNFRKLITRAIQLLGEPNLSDFFPSLARFDFQGIVKEMRDCTNKMDAMVEAAVEEMRDSTDRANGRECFLQFLLQLKDNGEKETRLTMDSIKGMLTDMIPAGTDTTSNTVEFAMAELMNKPQAMAKARKELEAVVGTNNKLEESHINQLPYIQAIMKETLRLHPIVPLLIPHTPSESCVVGGYTIPKGYPVFFNVWAIHRDPLVWEEPLEFKPERFLEKKYDFSGNNFNYIPFGSGRRICAGIDLAERMIMLPLASFLHYFDWKLPGGVETVDVSEKFGVTMKKATPLLLIPSPSLLSQQLMLHLTSVLKDFS